MLDRQFQKSDYLRLKARTRQMYNEVGGVVEASEYTRLKKSVHSEFQNPNIEKFAPLDVVMDLELMGGKPFVTEFLAEMQGYYLTPVEAIAHSGKTLVEAVIDANQKHHELSQETTKALADGKIDADEIKTLLPIAEQDFLASKRLFDALREASNKVTNIKQG